MKVGYLLFLSFLTLQANPSYINAPARDWLEKNYLPSLSGDVLYVGVGSYTQKYPGLTRNPERFATLDYDPEKALFGSPFAHYTADLLEFKTPKKFDHVSLFGIMGHPPTVTTSKYNIINEMAISQAIFKAHELIKIGGTLQLGPNHRDFPGQDASFWMDKLSLPPLDKYKILFFATYSDNMVWWGQKLQE